MVLAKESLFIFVRMFQCMQQRSVELTKTIVAKSQYDWGWLCKRHFQTRFCIDGRLGTWLTAVTQALTLLSTDLS